MSILDTIGMGYLVITSFIGIAVCSVLLLIGALYYGVPFLAGIGLWIQSRWLDGAKWIEVKRAERSKRKEQE